MSYALETKKRKFHRVLESLTKPLSAESSAKLSSATTASTSLPQHAPSAKRVRLSGKNDTDLTSIQKLLLKNTRPSSRDSSTSSLSRPSFVPWDRERFLERLETFRRVDRWSPKPSTISEVEWAKRGWICSDVSRVTCVGGCGGSVVVKLPDELDELDGYDNDKIQERKEVRTKLVEEYANLITQGHEEHCPWRNKGCDATIHRLPLSNPDAAISGLQTRYSNLVKIADQLPAQNAIQLPESFNIKDMVAMLPTEDFQITRGSQDPTDSQTPVATEVTPEAPSQSLAQAETQINEVAFTLSFFGWESASDGAVGLAACSACFRRLGLWIYKPKKDGEVTAQDPLDVIQEHMWYCPWVSGKAQSGTGRSSEKQEGLQSGWELLSQALKVKHRRQIRSIAPGDSRASSEVPSTDGSLFDEVNDDARKAKDREWWAKLRRMKEVLNVKSPKRKPPAGQ